MLRGTTANAPTDLVHAAIRCAEAERIDVLVARGFGVVEPAREKAALARAMLAEQATRDIAAALLRAHIDALFLKGAVADARWWGGRGWRGSSDVDVLVPREKERDAHRVLAELGYGRHDFRTHRATNDASKERLYTAKERTKPAVDLHVGLLNAPPFRDFAADAFVRARALDGGVLDGGALGVRALENEDMLVHIAGNLGGGHFDGRAKLALDAACLIERDGVDFDVVVGRAKRANVATSLWALLSIERARLGVAVPERVLDELRPNAAVCWAAARAAGVHGAPVQPQSAGRKLFAVEWPFADRPLWPLEATARWLRLRALDRVRALR